MSLKHLKDAVELLRAGMPIAEISAIVALKDEEPGQTEPEPSPEPGQPAPEPEPAPEPGQPATEPEPAPTKRPEVNNNPSTLIDDLNKIF